MILHLPFYIFHFTLKKIGADRLYGNFLQSKMKNIKW
jgi:hypothetical protein